ncbi:hypothetical protein L227DRAFT_65096 [Lentinus tigrinus ALCF2SS1-6]|uniref:Uncharacterized protein n=1 Tax=Lentinus tigrinus ALCF2SS1-6 TaxID=1328759 RepID=A0A5C2SCA6_9APHY|nr:hypothetical protein L227DRAFT_65096 [Lentinus tigrinus ALCF2SS1-6]
MLSLSLFSRFPLSLAHADTSSHKYIASSRTHRLATSRLAACDALPHSPSTTPRSLNYPLPQRCDDSTLQKRPWSALHSSPRYFALQVSRSLSFDCSDLWSHSVLILRRERGTRTHEHDTHAAFRQSRRSPIICFMYTLPFTYSRRDDVCTIGQWALNSFSSVRLLEYDFISQLKFRVCDIVDNRHSTRW